MACLDHSCTQLVVYERVHLVVKHYVLDLENPVASKRFALDQEDIDVLFNYQEINDQELEIEEEDMINDMRFLPDGKEVRMYII